MSSAALGSVFRDVGFLPKNASRNSEEGRFWVKGSVFSSPQGLQAANMRPKSSTKAVLVGKDSRMVLKGHLEFCVTMALQALLINFSACLGCLSFQDALEPFMSKRTLELHWGGYHHNCVECLNKQLKNSSLYGCTLEELIKTTYNNGNPLPEFNNAAEVWNHDFFWESMEPDSGKLPWGSLLHQIEKDFGSFSNLKDEFMESAMGLFGSGWVWLVLKREEKMLAVVRTSNAVCPLVFGDIPIIALDMWEHAYYLDYKEDRRRYVSNYMNHLVSWHSATLRIARAEAFVNLGEPKIPVA